MSTSTLVLMITVQVSVTVLCAYFFYRVMTVKPSAEPDSYSAKDDLVR